MTRICLGLKHLRENKINHNFQNRINPFCNCGMDIESTSHFFSSAPNLVIIVIISDLLSILSKTDCNLIEVYESSLTETLLFGKSLFELEKNFLIINASIDYIYCKQMREKVLKYFLTQN